MAGEHFDQGLLEGRLKLKQLRLLIAVAEEGSIQRAARKLNITQPAATKSIRDLERDLGVPLFERTARGATATVYGNALIAHARLILAEVRHAGEELSALSDGSSGHVAIGAALAATPTLLPRSLALVKRQRPGLSVTVIESTNEKLVPALVAGELDLVVGRLPEAHESDGLTREVLFNEPVRVVARAGHPLARARRLGLKQLADQPWILPLPGTSLRQQIDSAFLTARLPLPGDAVESVSIMTNLALLASSDMVAVMPHQVASAYADGQTLVCLPVSLDWDLGPVGLLTRRDWRLPPAARVLAETVRQVAVDLGLATNRRRRRTSQVAAGVGGL